MKGSREDKSPPAKAKQAWKKPLLIRLGHIKDFVQGHGKAGSRTDGDPFTMRRK
jgi:hypothetical protein